MDENLVVSENLEIEDDDDEIQVTPAEVVEIVQEAWINEKFSPEILPHKTEYVDILLAQIAYLQDKLKHLESTDIKKGLHQMELDRLRFLVVSYLRVRIKKIETYSAHIIEQERQRAEKNEEMYLSPNELVFVQEYDQGIREHFESVMSFCPGLGAECHAISPNMHSMVFVKSKEKIDGIVIDDGNAEDNDFIDITEGMQILISYNSVADLVKKGDVRLI